MEAAEAGVLKRLVPAAFGGISRDGRAMDAPERAAARDVMLSHTPAPVPAPLTLVEQSTVPMPDRAPVRPDGRPVKQVAAQRLPRTAKTLSKSMLGYTGEVRYPERDGLATEVRWAVRFSVPLPFCSWLTGLALPLCTCVYPAVDHDPWHRAAGDPHRDLRAAHETAAQQPRCAL